MVAGAKERGRQLRKWPGCWAVMSQVQVRAVQVELATSLHSCTVSASADRTRAQAANAACTAHLHATPSPLSW